MRSLKVILLTLLCIQQSFSQTQSYDCTIEMIEMDGDKEFCVFRNVKFFKNTTNVAFAFPGTKKPVNVAFQDSSMVDIPGKFLEVFGDDLKVLKVENSMLTSVTITSNMEVLHARNNYIEKISMHRNDRCASLTELDLSSNRLKDIRNVTNCEKLKVLNLSGNQNLWSQATIDISEFAKMNQLEELNLADNGVLYLDNSRNVGLPSLKLLDLSKNVILPSDLRMEFFFPFTALETLKLNDNNMDQVDYVELPDIQSLKTVYLNGNNFECSKINGMLKFLKEKNIATPLDRHSNCENSRKEVEGMCCKEPSLIPPITIRTSTTSPPITPKPITETPSETTPVIDPDHGETGPSWQIVAAVVVIIAIVAAGAGYFIYKKRSI